jgi:16S rRNA C1402 N4-methylase RsmH
MMAYTVQLTNAGIDLAQLGLGGLLAQEEEEDSTQYANRPDMDMGSSSMPIDFGAQGFGEGHADSQPDDMNLQAQSLIAALSALVPQSQATVESVLRSQDEQGTREAPITIDLTDEPDDEPVQAGENNMAEPQPERVPTAAHEQDISLMEAAKQGTSPIPVSPKTGDEPTSEK